MPRETVIQDYLLTNQYFDPSKVLRSNDRTSAQWRSLPLAVLKAYLAVDRSYTEAALRVVDTYPGGIKGYFRDSLGLSEADLAKLRHMYTA